MKSVRSFAEKRRRFRDEWINEPHKPKEKQKQLLYFAFFIVFYLFISFYRNEALVL